DGSWTLVRASSNKPSLVVVCESMRSKAAMRQLFDATADLLARYPEVGVFDQRP
ncbi:MAG: phosphomannomutase/phosphoglucomutase, partial [Hyphomicrobiales bacterium]|nr:phosphomannomutase/phosphoglucomutase [Hyphomicrobiales bacterium]